MNESVGIAVGMLLTALHRIGIVALTHTPSPMGFLAEALQRPANERAFLNIPIGFPAEGLKVPDLTRKPGPRFWWSTTEQVVPCENVQKFQTSARGA